MEQCIRKKTGISLVDVIFFIMIASFLSGALVNMMFFSSITSSLKHTSSNIEIISNAINEYIDRYGFLPCPASLTDTTSSSSYGFAVDCSKNLAGGVFFSGNGNDEVVQGAVPFKTLGLSEKYAFDAWNMRLRYAVINKLTNLKEYFAYYKPQGEKGSIIVLDKDNNSVVDKNKEFITYLVLSHGKKRVGGYGKNAQQAVQCSGVGHSQEIENCNNDSLFYYVMQNYDNNSYYDDMLHFVTDQKIKEYLDNHSMIKSLHKAPYCVVDDILDGSSSLTDGLFLLSSENSFLSSKFGQNSKFAIILKNGEEEKYMGSCREGDLIITAKEERFIIKNGQIIYNISQQGIIVVNDIVGSTAGSNSSGFYIANANITASDSSQISNNSIFYISHNNRIYRISRTTPIISDIAIVINQNNDFMTYDGVNWVLLQ